MSEKIIYTPLKSIPIVAKPGATAMDSPKHSRGFAELLAEAEAVQDVVQVGAAPLSAGVVPAGAGLRGSVRFALQSMAGLVRGPMPRWVMNLRGEKLRRDGARR